MGLNNLVNLGDDHLTTGITEEDDFYFVHSFGFTELPEDAVIAEANYGNPFPAIVRHENIYGVQFHPEKSQSAGIKIINNFLGVK